MFRKRYKNKGVAGAGWPHLTRRLENYKRLSREPHFNEMVLAILLLAAPAFLALLNWKTYCGTFSNIGLASQLCAFTSVLL